MNRNEEGGGRECTREGMAINNCSMVISPLKLGFTKIRMNWFTLFLAEGNHRDLVLDTRSISRAGERTLCASRMFVGARCHPFRVLRYARDSLGRPGDISRPRNHFPILRPRKKGRLGLIERDQRREGRGSTVLVPPCRGVVATSEERVSCPAPPGKAAENSKKRKETLSPPR